LLLHFNLAKRLEGSVCIPVDDFHGRVLQPADCPGFVPVDLLKSAYTEIDDVKV
jgi:hypothetical protein